MFGRILVAAGAGAFLALVGPPSNLYPALWVGMAVLAYVVDLPCDSSKRWPRLRRVFDGAGRGLAFGVGANLVFFRFVPGVVVRFTGLSFAAGVACLGILAILQGLVWAVAAVVQMQLTRRGVPSWVSFATGVFAGTFIPAIFRWTPAGPLSPVPEMIQLAELSGERGVTLLMALSSGLLAAALGRWVRARPRWVPSAVLLGAGLLVALLTFAEGKLRISRVERDREEAPTVTVGLVEPSSEALVRWDGTKASAILATLQNLTRAAEDQGAELTIWSESAYPYALGHDHRKAPGGDRAIVGPGVRGPVLAGFVGITSQRDQYNSAALFTSDGDMGIPYDKLRLLAFGEEIPWIGRIPWVHKTFVRAFGLLPGQANVVQVTGKVRASVLICVEDVLPESGRQAMADHPNLLVNMTNDAWFSGSRESELHLRLATPRSVESRRDMVRAVNLGPTSWIDAAGVVRSRYDGDAAGVLVVKPALIDWPLTPYDRFGDLPVVSVLVLVAGASMARARRNAANP
jgi:apolipoprotein N-acyltransferase